MTVTSPGDIHCIFNPGPGDILIHFVLALLPLEIAEVPGFDYPV